MLFIILSVSFNAREDMYSYLSFLFLILISPASVEHYYTVFFFSWGNAATAIRTKPTTSVISPG